MDDVTKKAMLTIATGVTKKCLLYASGLAVSHGLISGNDTETFVAIGMGVIAAGWSLWNDYGKAIVLSQLEVMKAKSLAQAAKIKEAGLPPVTADQIAEQSPTLTPDQVIKTVAKMPATLKS